MTVKEYLRGVRTLNSLIERKKEQLEELRSIIVYNGNLQGEFIQGSSDPANKRTEMLVKLVSLEEEIDSDITTMIERKKQAMALIDKLDDDKTLNIFYLRYLSYKTWEEIACELGITFQWVHELHKRGLIKLNCYFK